MENPGIQDYVEMEDEQFPDEFQCCVCLDIMYKPVVLACGHISCFWCVYKAMDTIQESHCPVCRNPYSYFPRICSLLHFLLMKLYPAAYKRKGRHVAEEERTVGHASPQFADNLIDSQLNEVPDAQNTPALSQATESNSTCSGNSLVQDSSKRTFPCEDNTIDLPTKSSSQATQETNGTVEQADLQCAVCKQLLFRPVVLNCGHVFCDTCTKTPQDSICKCPVCQSPHPYGFPSVCLVLQHFLEEQFPEEISARKESLTSIQNASPSGSSAERKEQAPNCSSVPADIYMSWYSGEGAKVHPCVGCDNCGMCPIIGERYKCKDCVEKIGFDLCESCYNSSSKLPGRFNQQHTSEHQFVVVPPPRPYIILNLPENSQDYGVDLVDPNNPQEAFAVPDLSNDVSDDDDNQDSNDDATPSPNSSNLF